MATGLDLLASYRRRCAKLNRVRRRGRETRAKPANPQKRRTLPMRPKSQRAGVGTKIAAGR